MVVAEKHPEISFIVQDRPQVIQGAKEQLPNITFEAQDFFLEHPIKDTDVYLLRQILQNWSDAYASRILRALIPALEVSGGAMVIMEQILPEPGMVSLPIERTIR